MKQRSIVLTMIPCGETVWDADGRLHGATDLPLSDAGRIHVAANMPELVWARPSMIYHASDDAATETARLCAEQVKARTKAVDELSDPNLGLLEGLTAHEFSERFPTRFKQWDEDPMTVSPPEGEDVIHAADRIFNAVAKIVKRTRGEEVGVVLHNLGHAMLRCWLADRPLHDVRAMLNSPTRIERIAIPVSLVRSLETAASAAQTAS